MSQNTMSVVKLNELPRDKYNVLIPVTTMQAMSNLQKIIVNEVRLDINPSGPDIYFEKSSQKYAITKVGAMKLAAAANISIVGTESVKPDICVRCIDMVKATGKAQACGNCDHRFDVKFMVTVRVPEPAGGFRLITKDRELDCVEEKNSMKPDQYKRFLPHRASIAETKAFMRCLRDALGVQSGYTLEELKKPFIIAHVAPNLDAPEIRERLADNYLSSMGLLFETPSTSRQIVAASEIPALPPANTAQPNNAPVKVGDVIGNVLNALPPASPPVDDDGLPFQDDGHFCADCGAEITATPRKNGTMMSPNDVYAFSHKRFGRGLCPNCQRSAMMAAKGGAA